MSDTDYKPPEVWTWDTENGGKFASINRPVSGATHDKDLPVGEHPHQLYSLATPNGVKVTVMFEELLEAGHSDAEYDAWLIKIGDGDQFGSGFVDVNPNSKIPALMDHSTSPPTRVNSATAGSRSQTSHGSWRLIWMSSSPPRLSSWNPISRRSTKRSRTWLEGLEQLEPEECLPRLWQRSGLHEWGSRPL